jgi:ComF family protein
MEGVARRLVHELKYRHVRVAAPVMAHLMHGLPDLRPFDLALPIPLHRQRQRERGFNQAELLVRALGWPSAPALLRSRRTDQQVGKHLTERRRNVNGAFSYGGGPLTGMTVALVDDVVTTGATADECAKVLKDHGARRVVAVAFARASYDPKTGRADE